MSTALQPQLKHKEVEITTEHVQQFLSFVNEGVVAWMKAGKLLVQMVERNPNTFSLIRKDNPQISIDVLLAFEKIGRNEIYPYLLLEDSPGTSRLLALPYDLQTEYYKTGVDVLTGWRNGVPIVEHKQVSGLTKQEALRVFSPSGARTVEEQKQIFPPESPRRSEPLDNKMGAGQIINTRTALNKNGVRSLGQFTFTVGPDGGLMLKKVPTRDGFAIPLEIDVNNRTSVFEVFIGTTK